MIKRYDLGAKAEKITAESVQFGLVGIVERPDGEYYKASDVDAILESIGAGGVNGRITGKTLEQHRAEFEEWLLLCQTFFDPDKTAKILQDVAWEAWKAAKGIKE